MDCRRAKPLWRRLIVPVALLLCLSCGQATAQEAIGAVSRLQGAASRTAGNATQPLGPNAPVFLSDVLSTGEGARLEVTLSDSTRVTLGEKARLTLDRYVFNPAADSGTIRIGVVGAFRFVSGKIAKLASSEVSAVTPIAAVGIRGTDFWAGPIDNQALGVLLIEGAVSVANAAGQQLLNQPGQGTNIAAAGAAPGPVTLWPQDKVNRALAAVAFQ